jgi:toxin ParE1/3/4
MIVWLPRAEKDLDTIYRATAEENPTVALDLLTRIDEAVRRLETFPHSGRPGRVSGTRELVVGGTPFILPYRVRGGVVQILHVLHGSRQWPRRF